MYIYGFSHGSSSQNWRGRNVSFLFSSQIIDGEVALDFKESYPLQAGFWKKQIFAGGV